MSITQARRFLGERGYRITHLQPAHMHMAPAAPIGATNSPTTSTTNSTLVECFSITALSVDTPQAGSRTTLNLADISRDERVAYESLCAILQQTSSTTVRDNILSHNPGIEHFYNNDYLLFVPDVITG